MIIKTNNFQLSFIKMQMDWENLFKKNKQDIILNKIILNCEQLPRFKGVMSAKNNRNIIKIIIKFT